MTALEVLHLLGALVVVLAIGWLGRLVARKLRQPEVIGEIAAGLLAGPALVALVGPAAFATVLPGRVIDALKLLAEVGLVLFLVGLAHKLSVSGRSMSKRTVSWVVIGGLVPAMLAGVVFACWILLVESPQTRGHAPLPAFLLMCAVVMSITAVPVLARILAERGLSDTAEGRLSMTAAVVIDTVGWLLLSVAVALASGRLSGFLQTIAVLGGGLLAALVVRSGLRSRVSARFAERRPALAAVVLAVIALVMGLGVERLGLTAIFGAVLVGLSVPPGGSWTGVAGSVARVGRSLIPVFFVVTGVTVFAAGLGTLPWTLIAVAVVLGVLGKGGGSFLGTRLAGESTPTALKVGVLMNTRGLTELIVLKVGFSAGVLTAPMFVALVIMAVVTTAMTGPLLFLLDRRAAVPQEVLT